MLRSSEPVMLPAGMEVKPSKCAVFHDGDQETTDTKVEKRFTRSKSSVKYSPNFVEVMIIANILESHFPFVEKMKNK